jgi:MFS family permease
VSPPGRLALLTRNRAFASLWAARTAWSCGDFTSLTVIALYVYETGASATQLGIAIAARVMPQALGPVAGALSDRAEPRRLLLACAFGRLAAMGAILLALPPFPVLVALIAVSGATTTLFNPTVKSAVPRLVERDELSRANAMLSFSHNTAFAIGPVIGAFLFDLAGARAAFSVDVGLCALLLTLLLTTLSRVEMRPAETGRAAAGHLLAEVREGLAYVRDTPAVRAVIVGVVLWILFAAVDNVALVFLLRDELGGSASTLGVANSAYGLAMIFAPMLVVGARWSASGSRLLLIGLAASGAGLLLAGVSPSLALAVLAYAIAGAGNGFENIGCDTTLGEHAEQDKLGRVFGIVYAPIFVTEALASLATGPLLEATSSRVAFVAGGCGVLAVTGLLWTMLRTARRGGALAAEPSEP